MLRDPLAPEEQAPPPEAPPAAGKDRLHLAPEEDDLAVRSWPARWRNEAAARAYALLADSKNVFRTQDGELIWVFTHPGTPTRFKSLDTESLAGIYADLGVTFWTQKTADRSVETRAPQPLLNRVLTGCFPTPVPILAGIAPGPYLLQSGDVITTAGYRPETRLWLAESGTVPLKVGKGPGCLRPHGFTQAEAVAGLALISADLADFPFATREQDEDGNQGLDEAVAFAYVLTMICRPALDTVPFMLFDAPLSGAGKDLIMKCLEILAHGKYARRITLLGDDYQDKNEIATALATGAANIVIADLRSETADNKLLFGLVSEPENRGIRKLGTNDENVLVPANLMLSATGCNVQFREQDMYRRTLQCRLTPAIPNPEDRPKPRMTEHALQKHFLANRPRYLAILFNVLRGYLHHLKTNPPPELLPCPTFTLWGELIQGALVWAGMTDPMRSLARMRKRGATSLGSGAMKALVQAWWRRFGTMELKCKTLFAAHDADPEGSDRAVSALRDALRNLQDKPLTERALGTRLAALDDTPFLVSDEGGALRYVKVEARNYGGSNSYRLIRDDKNKPPAQKDQV